MKKFSLFMAFVLSICFTAFLASCTTSGKNNADKPGSESSFENSNNDENARISIDDLTSTFTYKGISLPYNSEWDKYQPDGLRQAIYVDRGDYSLSIYFILHNRETELGDTKDLATYVEKGNTVMGPSNESDLELSNEYMADKTTSIKVYKDIKIDKIILALGYDSNTGKGFEVICPRFGADYKDWDEAVEYMFNHITYNPAQMDDVVSSSDITPTHNDDESDSNNGATGDSSVIGEGSYKVGTDIPAGEYKLTATNSLGGYWEVKNSSSAGAAIIENDNFDGTAYVTVSDGQYLKLSYCNGTKVD